MTAGSWGEDCAKHLTARPEVQRGLGHVCRFGVVVPMPACAGGGSACTDEGASLRENQPAG
eukprot:924509-Alexandrium_andersonii.AAC.1